MNKVTPQKGRLVVVLVFLVLLTYLAVHRHRLLTQKEAEDEAVGSAVTLKDMATHDGYAVVAVLALVALFGFVMWAVLHANQGEDKAMPPAKESSASDKTPAQNRN
jgi:hypothetical protein